MDCSTVDFPVFHYLPEFAQTHVHWVEDAIQQPHLLSSPSLPALNLSQHQDLFLWVSSSHQVVKVLFLQLQHSVFPMNIQGWFPLRWTGLISLLSKGTPRVFSNTTVQKHQFFSAQSFWWSTHIDTWLLKKPWLWPCRGKAMSLLFNMLSRFVIAFLLYTTSTKTLSVITVTFFNVRC